MDGETDEEGTAGFETLHETEVNESESEFDLDSFD